MHGGGLCVELRVGLGQNRENVHNAVFFYNTQRLMHSSVPIGCTRSGSSTNVMVLSPHKLLQYPGRHLLIKQYFFGDSA